MRRYLMFMVALLVVSACGKEVTKVNASLTVSKTEIILTADASVEELEIESSVDWMINGIPEWCGTVRPSYGTAGKHTVRIRGRFYDEKADRSAELTVVAGDKQVPVLLVQTGKRTVRVEADKVRIPSAGGSVKLTVDADYAYDMTIEQQGGWLACASSDLPLQGEIVLNAVANTGSADRKATLTFAGKTGEDPVSMELVQLCSASENRYYDGDVKLLLKSKKEKGFNAVFMGDGFTAEDLQFGGELDRMAELALETMFSIEPMASYKDYFNVYLVAAESAESGIGRVTAKNTALRTFFRGLTSTDLTLNLDDNAVYSYLYKTGITDKINTAILVFANTDEVGGTNISYPDGRCIAISTKAGSNHYGAEGVIRHEFVGHCIGRLADAYVYYSGEVTPEYVQQLAERHANGWSLNIDTTDDPTKVAWKHFIGVPGYEKVGCHNYAGGVMFMGGGVCEPENHFLPGQMHCMVDNTPYFDAPSREQIVKHILEFVGEEYSFEAFIAQDKLRYK